MKIVLAGSGNVAMHLGPALLNAGHTIVQVVGRSETGTRRLAKKLSCSYTVDTSKIEQKADVFILAIRDEAIANFVKKIPHNAKLVLHTSGSVDSKVFSRRFKNYGILYPVQSLSAKRKVNFSKIPLCLEASTATAKKQLLTLANSLSETIHWVNYNQRLTIHLAAVFANNFSNHLFTISQDILAEKDIEFDILRPLIMETASKVQINSPVDMQTGPARRGDSTTIAKHLSLLKKDQLKIKIYEAISNSILDKQGPKM
ncbi:MAG: DUF2520 domain-containing protein [Bacteroidia bacterium]|nr:DUF2520 domain-containing protein [Bacteroidia bacterium]